MLRRPLALSLLLALAATACIGSEAAEPPADDGWLPVAAPAVDVPCLDQGGIAKRGARIMAGRLQLGSHPEVDLPSDPTWREDPLRERNWRARYQNLRWTEDLVAAYQETGDAALLRRWRGLLRDWVQDNPVRRPRSDFSWQQHVTGQRATVYACATRFIDEPWLWSAIRLHGRMLAKDGFYERHGNHALNQNIGLFLAGCAADHDPWRRTAVHRLRVLGLRSIDEQGVNDEQSIFYHYYNYRRYGVALRTVRGCDVTPPPVLTARRAKMVRLLTHATMPDGEYVRLGDTLPRPAASIEGTTAQFAASLGRRGPKPAVTSAMFRAGYAFGRTGWGERSPYRDEVMYALRFGTPRVVRGRDIGHAHDEGTSLQLYGYGDVVLEDAGAGRYLDDAWRRYFRGPSGQNRVTVDDRRFDPSARTRLVSHRITRPFDSYVLATPSWDGVRTVRRVVFSRRGGYVLVQDQLSSRRPIRARQWWHLPSDAAPTVTGRTLRTTRDRGNVTVRVLAGARRIAIARGERRPLQGWASYRYGRWEPAPVGEVVATGRRVRVLTLLTPWGEDERPVRARVVRDGPGRTVVAIRVGGRTERVIFAGELARLTRG